MRQAFPSPALLALLAVALVVGLLTAAATAGAHVATTSGATSPSTATTTSSSATVTTPSTATATATTSTTATATTPATTRTSTTATATTPATTRTSTTATATTPGTTTTRTTTTLATTTTPATKTSAPVPVIQSRPGVLTARIVGWTAVRHQPGPNGRIYTWVGPLTSWSHEQQTLLVVGTAERHGQAWLRVLLGVRPDGSNGWIPRRLVQVSSDPWWVTVDKTTRTVTVSRDGVQKLKVKAVIGAAATPTPDGIAAIWESNPQPSANDFLGSWAMPLTVLSNVLTNFGGGPGRVAIHGRGGASLENPLGSAASHGCIRIDNSAILWIARHVPVGTPVDITGQ